MKITKLQPSGFCYGVRRSFDLTLETLAKSKNKKVYLLGWLVHNRNVVNQLKSMDLILLDDKDKSRLDIIKQLNNTNNHDVIILSAHGTDYEAIELAKSKGYEIVDLTCPYVYKTHLLIKQRLKEGYDVFFIGKKNHPETKAILKINKAIKLITSINDIEQYDFSHDKVFCTNQTTLSIYEINDLLKALKLKKPNIEFINDICDATTKRQEAIYNLDDSVDLILVLGDLKSSNSMELLKLAQQKASAYLINNKQDIMWEWFNNKNHCVIVSAASSPDNIADETITCIKEHFYEN